MHRLGPRNQYFPHLDSFHLTGSHISLKTLLFSIDLDLVLMTCGLETLSWFYWNWSQMVCFFMQASILLFFFPGTNLLFTLVNCRKVTVHFDNILHTLISIQLATRRVSCTNKKLTKYDKVKLYVPRPQIRCNSAICIILLHYIHMAGYLWNSHVCGNQWQHKITYNCWQISLLRSRSSDKPHR